MFFEKQFCFCLEMWGGRAFVPCLTKQMKVVNVFQIWGHLQKFLLKKGFLVASVTSHDHAFSPKILWSLFLVPQICFFFFPWFLRIWVNGFGSIIFS